MKTVVIGESKNYIASAFAEKYELVEWEEIRESKPENCTVFDGADVIIFAHEKKYGPLQNIWFDNYGFLDLLNKFCQEYNKKLVYISTADLYGNSFEWDENTETCETLDMNTDYRLSKRVGERLLDNSNSLVVRIKTPFDSRNHSDNWLIRGYSEKPFVWLDTYTFIPDLIRAVDVLVEHGKSGCYNVVNTESGSTLHYFKSVLNEPDFADLDDQSPNVRSEIHNEIIHSDVNNTKISELVKFTPMEVAVTMSWAILKKELEEHKNLW